MQKVSEKIKHLRELKNYTQEYMAVQLGMTQAGYSKIESGQTDVTYSKLEEIAKLLEVSVEDLLAFDSQRFFNSFNNIKGNNNGSITIGAEANEIKKLYEDKIILLEKLLKSCERELNAYKDKYGDL
jgi:transcriptional regulator with XRE-family HTH domain